MSDPLRQISPPALDHVQAGIAAVLIGLALVLVPCALFLAARVWAKEDRRLRWAFVAVVAAAALVRAFVPARLAMIFIGYKMTADALALFPVGHYGIGAQALYHLLLSLFPADHRVLTGANAVMGVLSVPLFATVAARMFKDARVGLVAGALAACVPMFVRNDVSEANHVPALLFLWAGLIFVQEFLETRKPLPLVGAVPLLALSAISRPEMIAFVFVLLAVTAIASEQRPRWIPVTIAALAILALATPHLLHVRNAVNMLGSESSLQQPSAAAVWSYLIERNALVQPRFFPLGVGVLAAWALFSAPGSRRTRIALMGATVIALLLYFVDCDKANAARVNVPAALCLTLLGAAGGVDLWRRRRALGGVAVLGVFASAIPTVPFLFQPTNEQAEEALIRRARAALPDESYVLVRIGDLDLRDENGGSTHPYFPDYLFPSARLYALSTFLRSPRFDLPVYFLESYRCYARFRPERTPPPRGDDLRAPCAMFERELDLELVFEEDAPNHGNVWLNYYGDAPTLRVGLYRVHPGPPRVR